MIYLASPYSYVGDAEPSVKKKHRELRYRQTMCAQAALFNAGYPVFATIVHTHVTALAYQLPTEAAPWIAYNHHMIDLSQAVFVLQLDGWDKSIGVTDELQYAYSKAIPVYAITISQWRDDELSMEIPIIPELQTLHKVRKSLHFEPAPMVATSVWTPPIE